MFALNHSSRSLKIHGDIQNKTRRKIL